MEKGVAGLRGIDSIILVTLSPHEINSENISKKIDASGEASVNIDMISQTIMGDGGLNLSFDSLDRGMKLREESIGGIGEVTALYLLRNPPLLWQGNLTYRIY